MSIFFILLTVLTMSITEPMTIFDFSKAEAVHAWTIVNDGVMGGLSQSQIKKEKDHALFSGQISLENNGGFASVRYRFEPKSISDFQYVVLTVKGDGKRYQFRLKAQPDDYQSYVQYFRTSGDWQEIIIPLSEMYPTFRGRKLAMPSYDSAMLSEVAFLIGNKKEESFQLRIARIELR